MAPERDAQHFPLHATVEALDHAVRARRVGLGLTMLHTVPPAGALEGVSREARAAVSQHVRDLEGKGSPCLVEEGDGRGGGLVVFHRQVHVAGGAIDGDVQVALARDAVAILQLGQVLHVHMHEADLVVLEAAVRLASLFGGRQPVEALGLEDAVDRVPVQVRQEVREDEGEIVERKACAAAERAHDGALLIGGFPRQLMRPGGAVLAVGGPRLRHLRMVSVETP